LFLTTLQRSKTQTSLECLWPCLTKLNCDCIVPLLYVTTSSLQCQQPPAFWLVEDQSTEYAPTWDLPVVLQVSTSSQSSQTNAFSITTRMKMANIDNCLIFHSNGKVLTIKWPKTTSNHWWELQNVIQIVCDSVCMNSCLWKPSMLMQKHRTCLWWWEWNSHHVASKNDN
jgi:hypothetical protein